MKGLNQIELEQICDEIQTWVGAQLQDMIASDAYVALGFYHQQKVRWMMFDFSTQSPVFLLLDELTVKRLKKQTKPLTLFVRAHFESKRLASAELVKDQGRVIRLMFHSDVQLTIDVILFAYAKNLIATAGDKKMSFFKPKEVTRASESVDLSGVSIRSFAQIQSEWISEKFSGGEKSAPKDRVGQLNKLIAKKSSILEKMQKDIQEKSLGLWSEAGEWIKLNQSLDLPAEFLPLIDREKSLSENIENCFHRAKDQERKVAVARERVEVLTRELNELKKSVESDSGAPVKQLPPQKNFLQKVGAQARSFKLDDNLVAYIGKSAKDNLDILRRAQAFDLWMHLRDQPGAHVVIRRTRDRVVTDQELRQIGVWLIAENFGKKAKDKSGQIFDLIICECRYVKPIKGDKLGRVHFQKDRNLRVKFDA